MSKTKPRPRRPQPPDVGPDGWPDAASVMAQLDRWYAVGTEALWLIGPPGSGKTTLAKDWLAQMQARGHAGTSWDGPLDRVELPALAADRWGRAPILIVDRADARPDLWSVLAAAGNRAEGSKRAKLLLVGGGQTWPRAPEVDEAMAPTVARLVLVGRPNMEMPPPTPPMVARTAARVRNLRRRLPQPRDRALQLLAGLAVSGGTDRQSAEWVRRVAPDAAPAWVSACLAAVSVDHPLAPGAVPMPSPAVGDALLRQVCAGPARQAWFDAVVAGAADADLVRVIGRLLGAHGLRAHAVHGLVVRWLSTDPTRHVSVFLEAAGRVRDFGLRPVLASILSRGLRRVDLAVLPVDLLRTLAEHAGIGRRVIPLLRADLDSVTEPFARAQALFLHARACWQADLRKEAFATFLRSAQAWAALAERDPEPIAEALEGRAMALDSVWSLTAWHGDGAWPLYWEAYAVWAERDARFPERDRGERAIKCFNRLIWHLRRKDLEQADSAFVEGAAFHAARNDHGNAEALMVFAGLISEGVHIAHARGDRAAAAERARRALALVLRAMELDPLHWRVRPITALEDWAMHCDEPASPGLRRAVRGYLNRVFGLPEHNEPWMSYELAERLGLIPTAMPDPGASEGADSTAH